jgi:hypothetical protein
VIFIIKISKNSSKEVDVEIEENIQIENEYEDLENDLAEMVEDFSEQDLDSAFEYIDFYGYAAMLAYTENSEFSVSDIYDFYKKVARSKSVEKVASKNEELMEFLGMETENLVDLSSNIDEIKSNIESNFQNIYENVNNFSMTIEILSDLEEKDDLYTMKIKYIFTGKVNGKETSYSNFDDVYFMKNDENYYVIFANFLNDINNAFEISTTSQQLTDLEISIHNARFSSYVGTISGKSVQNLLEQVNASNKLYTTNKDKLVTVIYKSSESENEKVTSQKFKANEEDYVIWNNGYYIITPKVSDTASYSYVNSLKDAINDGDYYNVEFDYDYFNAGYITTVIVSSNY